MKLAITNECSNNIVVNNRNVILRFFAYLNEKNIEYVWLHSYNRSNLGDIDICIAENSIKEIKSLLIEFSYLTNYQLVQIIQHESKAFYYVLVNKENKMFNYLILDICSDYIRDGKLLIKAEEILKNRQSYEGYFIPQPQVEAYYILLKCLLKGRWLKHHWDEFVKLYSNNKQAVDLLFSTYYKKTPIQFNTLNYEEIIKITQNIKTEVQKTINYKLSNVIYKFNDLILIIRRIFFPTGFFLVVLGPDGCGKSSFSNTLINNLNPIFRNKKIFHWRPKVINVKSNNEKENSNTTPHSLKSRGVILSTIKFLLYLIDYIVGYLILLLPLKIKSHLIVFDRYYYDFLFDNKRYRLDLPNWIYIICQKLIPKPDLVFSLHASPQKIYERKSEISPIEIDAQYNRIKKIKGIKNIHYQISTECDIEKSVAIGCQIILDLLSQKIEKK